PPTPAEIHPYCSVYDDRNYPCGLAKESPKIGEMLNGWLFRRPVLTGCKREANGSVINVGEPLSATLSTVDTGDCQSSPSESLPASPADAPGYCALLVSSSGSGWACPGVDAGRSRAPCPSDISDRFSIYSERRGEARLRPRSATMSMMFRLISCRCSWNLTQLDSRI